METTAPPEAAYDRFMSEQAPASHDQRRWTPACGPVPTT